MLAFALIVAGAILIYAVLIGRGRNVWYALIGKVGAGASPVVNSPGNPRDNSPDF